MSDVTIIIPVYCNTDERLGWLEECLQSAISQGCEVVAYDDGSTVNVRALLSKYIKTFAYSDTNRGVAFARNECVKLVKTSLIFPLDCDDRLKPGSIQTLERLWKGIPLYVDLAKFGLINDNHYQLMEFDCSHITKFVGFTSVNVLHSVEQHNTIGGWDITLDFYEDGEYNARLFARYCGQRHAEPLVEYRIHATQRTKRYQKKAAAYATNILAKIRSIDMACSACSKRRSSVTNTSSASVSNLPAATNNFISLAERGAATQVLIGESYQNVPLEFEGKVLAVYVGGQGRMKHYYNGVASNTPYKVKYGDHLYVDPRDARTANMISDTRLLVRVERAESKPVVVVQPQPAQPVEVATMPEPVKLSMPDVPQVVHNLPDIGNLKLSDLKAMDELGELDGVDIPALIRMEARGKNRKQVIDWLKGRA